MDMDKRSAVGPYFLFSDIFSETDSTDLININIIVIVYLMKRKATDATPMIAKTQGPAPTHHKLFHILVIGKYDILAMSW